MDTFNNFSSHIKTLSIMYLAHDRVHIWGGFITFNFYAGTTKIYLHPYGMNKPLVRCRLHIDLLVFVPLVIHTIISRPKVTCFFSCDFIVLCLDYLVFSVSLSMSMMTALTNDLFFPLDFYSTCKKRLPVD